MNKPGQDQWPLNADIRRETSGASAAIGGDYAAAVARESALQARVNQLKAGLLDLRGRSIQYNILQREDTNRTLYTCCCSASRRSASLPASLGHGPSTADRGATLYADQPDLVAMGDWSRCGIDPRYRARSASSLSTIPSQRLILERSW